MDLRVGPDIVPPMFYYENIPLKRDTQMDGEKWVPFVTFKSREGGRYRKRSSAPTACGGFSDIWQCDGHFSNAHGESRSHPQGGLPNPDSIDARFPVGAVVAVKTLRAVRLPSGLDNAQIAKRLLKRLGPELQIWMRLEHPNVVPLVGFTITEEIALVSPWFERGNVSKYLEAHPDANRMRLTQGFAAGLAYLHSSTPVIVHGDIKPDNILVDKYGHARIIDFGLSKLVEEEPGLSALNSSSLRDAGNARWVAPELILEENASRSRLTDIYSFGCVLFFLLTGDVPFKSVGDGPLVVARYKGAHPMQAGAEYPELSDRPWLVNTLHSCWEIDPDLRPTIESAKGSLFSKQPAPENVTPSPAATVSPTPTFGALIATFEPMTTTFEPMTPTIELLTPTLEPEPEPEPEFSPELELECQPKQKSALSSRQGGRKAGFWRAFKRVWRKLFKLKR